MKLNKYIDINFLEHSLMFGINIFKAKAIYRGMIIRIFFICWLIEIHTKEFNKSRRVEND